MPTSKDLLEQMLEGYEQPEDLPDYARRYPSLMMWTPLPERCQLWFWKGSHSSRGAFR